MKEVKEKGDAFSMKNPLQLKISIDSGNKLSGEIIILSAKILELQ